MVWHWTAITWTQNGLVYWRIHASLGRNELRVCGSRDPSSGASNCFACWGDTWCIFVTLSKTRYCGINVRYGRYRPPMPTGILMHVGYCLGDSVWGGGQSRFAGAGRIPAVFAQSPVRVDNRGPPTVTTVGRWAYSWWDTRLPVNSVSADNAELVFP